MKAYWVKTNLFIKKLFSGYVWDIPNTEKKIYLTFDDGPTPEITDWVLRLLKKHGATASFFSIGKNIEENPEIFKRIITDGHSIGNHTQNHLNGWETSTRTYIENFNSCNLSISNIGAAATTTKIFRPPYGKIKSSQAKYVKAKGYKIIMWDVLSADFDQNITKEKCLDNVISNMKSGSIIVFHDSIKAFENLKYALPKTLEFIEKNQYKYGIIN
jgi:peptidoglycan/xylan/chitin deacetylase (PgdA/CDA1 family)